MKDEQLYLQNIKECIDRIESYTIEEKAVFLKNTIK